MAHYLDELSEFLAATRFADLPEAVVAHSKVVIADTIAAIAAGAREPEVQALTASQAGASTGPATIIGAGRRADPQKAAFLNGTAGTFLEMDEGNQFSRGHPSIHALPSALAYAEAHGHSGAELILAVVLGYEIGSRIGIAAKIRPSMHPHGTWGTVSAAVAVAVLAGADSETMKRTINVASTLGLATSRQNMLQGGTVRNAYAGISGQMGLLAQDMIAAGFTGERDGLATIWGQVLSESFEPAEMTRELGSRWEIERNYFKRHSCCRYNHGTLDALAEIAGKRPGGLKAEDIEKVDVLTYSLAAELSDRDPKNTLAGKFSVPFAVATTIINRSSGMMSFTWDQIRSQEIKALAAKVEVREDPKLTAMMPLFRPARVTVTFTDGSTLEGSTETNRGDAEDPYSAAELTEKYYELTARAWDRPTAEAVYGAIAGLDTLAGMDALTGPMDAAGPAQTEAAE
jgi:2-methylcitrate dehydratase PrpD